MIEIQLKEEEYKNYINNHKLTVQRVWNELQLKSKNEFFILNKELNEKISKRILCHDDSKYSIEEFDPYRKFFYPTNNEKKNYQDFRLAFQIHYSKNDHHWEYWLDKDGNPVNRGDLRDETIIEMFCDWQAMSYMFGDTPQEYYEKNKHKIKLLKEDTDFFMNIVRIFYN